MWALCPQGPSSLCASTGEPADRNLEGRGPSRRTGEPAAQEIIPFSHAHSSYKNPTALAPTPPSLDLKILPKIDGNHYQCARLRLPPLLTVKPLPRLSSHHLTTGKDAKTKKASEVQTHFPPRKGPISRKKGDCRAKHRYTRRVERARASDYGS